MGRRFEHSRHTSSNPSFCKIFFVFALFYLNLFALLFFYIKLGSLLYSNNSLDEGYQYSVHLVGNSTAARHWANCPPNCIFPKLLCFQKWKFWEFCRILKYFSLDKGPFTRPWGRLEKSLPFYFMIITSYLKMSRMSWFGLSLFYQGKIWGGFLLA